MNGGLDPWRGFTFPPRRWQAEAYPVAMQAIRDQRRGIIQAATGAGKTQFTGAVVRTVCDTLRPGWRVVVTVPRMDLVDQTVKALRDIMPHDRVGAWYGRRKEYRPILVCCNASFGTLTDRILMEGHRVALWFCDEVHRSAADGVQECVARLQPWARLGVTATPFRSADDEVLTGWDEMLYRYPIQQAIADEVLVDFRLVPWRGEDDHDANDATAEMILQHAPPGPGIVSATDQEDAEVFAEWLRDAHGIPAMAIHSGMSKREQTKRKTALMSGELRCLVHVDLLTEGVDFPSLRWLAMRRPRKSPVAIVQEVGRLLRTMPNPDRWGPKTEAVVMLPHPTPVLRSVAREAELGNGTASTALAEAADDEMERAALEDEEEHQQVLRYIEKPLPGAVSVGDVEAWVAGLVAAAESQGVDMGKKVASASWRYMAPTADQLNTLTSMTENARKSPVKYLPERHREGLKTALLRPEVLGRGGVADLLTLLMGCRRMAGKTYARHKRGWKLADVGLPPVPHIALGSLLEEEDRTRYFKRFSRRLKRMC